jgi:hypothetical protein
MRSKTVSRGTSPARDDEGLVVEGDGEEIERNQTEQAEGGDTVITSAGMPWDANRSRKNVMRAWSAFPDPRMGIYRDEQPEISQR